MDRSWRTMHSDELHDLYSSFIKPYQNYGWCLETTQKKWDIQSFCSENFKGVTTWTIISSCEDMLTLKWVLDGVGECGRNLSSSLVGTNGRLLWTESEPSVFKKECNFFTSWMTNKWLVMKECGSCSSGYWLVGWFGGLSVGWSVGCLVDQSVGLSVLLVCLVVCLSVGWLDGWGIS